MLITGLAMGAKVITLLGAFRSGTNFTRALLELNFDVTVNYNSLGWKHGPVPTFSADSPYSYCKDPVLTVVRDPYQIILSWYIYTKEAARNLYSLAEGSSFSEFARAPISFRDDLLKDSPEYSFASPVAMWSFIVDNHVSYALGSGGDFVRYEQLTADPLLACEQIASKFGLSRKSDDFIVPKSKVGNMSDSACRENEKDYLRSSTGQPQYLFSQQSPRLDAYNNDDFAFVKAQLPSDLLLRLGYLELRDVDMPVQFGLATQDRSQCLSDELLAFTVASDGRISDLMVLLESISRFKGFKLSVIPFDDADLDYTQRICDLYGIQIAKPSTDWDDLGKFFFSEKPHAERGDAIKAWSYFRKLNAISLSAGRRFLFFDANTAIAENADVLSISSQADMIFGHRSKFLRNFTPWATFLIGKFSPTIIDGFGAGFWLSKEGALDEGIFSEMVKFPGLRSMLGPAPEQSVLNLAIALKGLKVSLLREVSNYEYCMIARDSSSLYSCESNRLRMVTRRGVEKRVFAAKWTGNYHKQEVSFNGAGIHLPLVKSALARISDKGLTELKDFISQQCKIKYGYDFL